MSIVNLVEKSFKSGNKKMDNQTKESFKCRKKIIVVFPKDSESVFNSKKRTFGGATVQLFNYAMELSENHEVYCLLNETDGIDFKKFPTLNIIFSFNKNDSYIKKIVKFHKAVQSIKPDVIIQRGLTRISTFLGFYCRFYRFIYVFMFAHDRECRGRFQRSGRINLFYPLLLFVANYLVAQNDYQYNHIQKFFMKKLFKITNGYPINLTDIDSKTGVLWVSRLEPWKRPELCIEAAVKNPDISFTMIAPVDENNREYAEKIYKMAGNINNITIHDFVGFLEIDVYFKNARVFLNTSTEEGFPNTFIQACKNMTPIISLNVNPDDFLTRYGAGEYCANNVDKMNRTIVSICTNDSLFEKYSVSAGEYVKNHHCIKANVKKLEKLFV